MRKKTEYYKNEVKTTDNMVNGNLFKVIMSIMIPVFLYNMLNYGYEFFDTFILSVSNNGGIESLYVLSQIKKTINPLGSALLSGALVLVAQKIGAKKLEEANTFLNTVFYALLIISAVLLIILVPFAPAFLALINTPKEIILAATGYFTISIISLVVEWFNALFIGLTRAKGKAKVLFYLNLGAVVIKVILSTLFAYGNFGEATFTYLSLATLVSQLFILAFAIYYMFKKDSIVYVKPKFRVNKKALKLILAISLPIFFGEFLFNYAKVIVNAESSVFYGVSVLSALGLSNMIISLNQQSISALGSALKVVVGHNYGNNNNQRVVKSLNLSLLVGLAFVSINFVLFAIFAQPLANTLLPENASMGYEIIKIQKYEVFFMLLITMSSSFLHGMGKTKAGMYINIIRVAVVRIPLLYIFYYVFNMDYTASILVLVISNAVTAALIYGYTVYLIRKKLTPTKPTAPHLNLEPVNIG